MTALHFRLLQTTYLLECQMLYHTGLVGTLVVVLVPDSLLKGRGGVCTAKTQIVVLANYLVTTVA